MLIIVRGATVSTFRVFNLECRKALLLSRDFVDRLLRSFPKNQLLLLQANQFQFQFLQPDHLVLDG